MHARPDYYKDLGERGRGAGELIRVGMAGTEGWRDGGMEVSSV